jgi:hypothetical protein
MADAGGRAPRALGRVPRRDLRCEHSVRRRGDFTHREHDGRRATLPPTQPPTQPPAAAAGVRGRRRMR